MQLQCSLKMFTVPESFNATPSSLKVLTLQEICSVLYTVLSLLAPPLPSHEGVHRGAREPKAVNTFTVTAEEVWTSDDGLPC